MRYSCSLMGFLQQLGPTEPFPKAPATSAYWQTGTPGDGGHSTRLGFSNPPLQSQCLIQVV